ncbi:MAG: hypothetical protein FJW35_13200 [Acidobacteria bacterium]|nr:hypothetical protein [Acidobacteriota bacterium]
MSDESMALRLRITLPVGSESRSAGNCWYQRSGASWSIGSLLRNCPSSIVRTTLRGDLSFPSMLKPYSPKPLREVTPSHLSRGIAARAAITVILAGVLGRSVGLGLLKHSGCPAGPPTGGSTGNMTADGRSRELQKLEKNDPWGSSPVAGDEMHVISPFHGRVVPGSFDDHPVLTIDEMPQVEVHI